MVRIKDKVCPLKLLSVFEKDLFGQMPTLLLGVGIGNAHSEMQEGP